ncbi:MAG: hypothetical protein GC155_06380 [Alphaproteobacteria bacterium]|nr:hypothetical protein [Alphaproteobacteria bacterium]
MRKLLLAAAAATAFMAAPVAFADDAKYSVEKNTIGELVQNEETKAALMKVMPDLINNPDLSQGYEMKFPDIVQYVPDLTPEKLKQMDEELAKVK